MGYQLPQEVRTEKLNNAPDDIKAIAEELIAKKLGIPEVAEGEVQKDPDFFGQTVELNMNTVRGELISHKGQRYNFVMQLSPTIEWAYPSTTSTGSWSGSSESPVVSYIREAVQRQVRDFERRYNERADRIILELNGYRQELYNGYDIEEVVRRAYRKQPAQARQTWTTTTAMPSNWSYT